MINFILFRMLFKLKFYFFLIAFGWYINETGMTKPLINSGIQVAKNTVSQLLNVAEQALKKP